MKEPEMRILCLTLNREPFVEILEGRKKVEYRWFKPYWITRLHNKEYDIVQFSNGYGNDRPAMRVEFKGIRIFTGSSPIGTGQQYAISLGDVLETWKTSKLLNQGLVKE